MAYLYDCHVHTAETSWCGVLSAEDMVRRYAQAGYTGIVITDHYIREYFESLPERTWEDKVARYLEGYNGALAAGKKYGLTVLLGIELRFFNRIEDYLVYGLTPEFLREHPRLYDYTVETFIDFSRAHRLLIAQAHPFRPGQGPAPGACLDGMEVFNGNPRQTNNNHLALEYAKRHNLIQIAGSDAHQSTDVGVAGVYLDRPVSTSVEFAEYLRENRIPPRKTQQESAVGL
ncbi:MAG TPA: PHP domain-containing protein [Firmicutes bacterium]|jgi:predicted metal-dependent phosphoesterase TrpH|nr:MAG: hypothetical protein AA931_09560 [Peptococcaceae bacterium 1109]HHT73683.1 PHP domain-containing protein [Bacillota bacterium]